MFAEVPPIHLVFELSTALAFGVSIGGGIGTACTFVTKMVIAVWTRQNAQRDAREEKYIAVIEKSASGLAVMLSSAELNGRRMDELRDAFDRVHPGVLPNSVPPIK